MCVRLTWARRTNGTLVGQAARRELILPDPTASKSVLSEKSQPAVLSGGSGHHGTRPSRAEQSVSRVPRALAVNIRVTWLCQYWADDEHFSESVSSVSRCLKRDVALFFFFLFFFRRCRTHKSYNDDIVRRRITRRIPDVLPSTDDDLLVNKRTTNRPQRPPPCLSANHR